MRYARGALKLGNGFHAHNVELRPIAQGGSPALLLEIHRDDAKPFPVVFLRLDEAQAFLRSFQSACDEAYRLAKEAHKRQAEVTP